MENYTYDNILFVFFLLSKKHEKHFISTRLAGEPRQIAFVTPEALAHEMWVYLTEAVSQEENSFNDQ